YHRARVAGGVEEVAGRGHRLGDRVAARVGVNDLELTGGRIDVRADVACLAGVVHDGEAARAGIRIGGDGEGGPTQQRAAAVAFLPGDAATGADAGLPQREVVERGAKDRGRATGGHEAGEVEALARLKDSRRLEKAGEVDAALVESTGREAVRRAGLGVVG